MVTKSIILAWEIPWTEEPGRLQTMGLQRVGHRWGELSAHKNGDLKQWSPNSWSPGTTFMEDNSSTDRGWGWGSGWFGDDSSTWHLLCTLFLLLLHQLHLRSQGWEDLLEEGTAAHFSILDWEIPWTEEPGGLQSMGSQRVRHNLATKRKWRKPVTSVAHLYAKHISGHCRSIALLCLRKFHRLSYVNISFTAGASYLDTADKEFAKKGKAKEMTQAT